MLCLGTNRAATLQGNLIGVSIHIQAHYAPHATAMHCFVCKNNLTLKALFALSIIRHAKKVLSMIYNYFSKSPKKFNEFSKLVDHRDKRFKNALHNISTQWVSIIEPLKRVLVEFCIFI